jgi:hypothetical protein
MGEGGGQRTEDRGQTWRTQGVRAGLWTQRPALGRRGLLSDAEACSRTQRPASLQNVECSLGLQALGPKLDVGFFWTQGQGSLGKRDIEAKEQIIF